MWGALPLLLLAGWPGCFQLQLRCPAWRLDRSHPTAPPASPARPSRRRSASLSKRSGCRSLEMRRRILMTWRRTREREERWQPAAGGAARPPAPRRRRWLERGCGLRPSCQERMSHTRHHQTQSIALGSPSMRARPMHPPILCAPLLCCERRRRAPWLTQQNVTPTGGSCRGRGDGGFNQGTKLRPRWRLACWRRRCLLSMAPSSAGVSGGRRTHELIRRTGSALTLVLHKPHHTQSLSFVSWAPVRPWTVAGVPCTSSCLSCASLAPPLLPPPTDCVTRHPTAAPCRSSCRLSCLRQPSWQPLPT